MSEQTPARQGLQIPLWVALAGMIVALIIAIIIMANILRPLVNLVFPNAAEIPLPPDAELIETNENPRTSDGEWLYGSPTDGCVLLGFFVEAGGTCTLAPFACVRTDDSPDERGYRSVGSCTGTKSDILNSYSWEVLIGTGYSGEYTTRFRVYLYEER